MTPVSITSRCSDETAERIDLVLNIDATFDLSYTLYCKEIRVSPEVREVSFRLHGILSQTLGVFCRDTSTVVSVVSLVRVSSSH